MERPAVVTTERELDDILSIPQEETVEMMKRLEGDIMILGVGGKMGPTLAMTAVKACRNAGVNKTVYGVARFSEPGIVPALSAKGIECVRCDLLESSEIERLPRVDNIVFMAGRKFGIVGSDHLTWALNTIVPANVARAFPESRFVVFSTGSIYDLRPVDTEGPAEDESFTCIGEYANSCLGRERIFEYYSRANGTRVLQYRLNYAIDLRYGVLFEVGRQVFEGRPVNLTMGYANVIWQGDANNIALRSLELAASPPEKLNVTGGKVRIRDVAESFGRIWGKKPVFEGAEAPTAFLSNTAKLRKLLGAPPTSVDTMIHMLAGWIERGGKSLDKPTHFQTRDGQFLDA